MKELVARCGYRCDLCPGYIENIHSEEDITRVSRGWLQYIGYQTPPDWTPCRGCLDEGEPADSSCPVRPCVNEKELDNCAHCDTFPCDKLGTRMNFIEEHIEDLENIPRDDYNWFIKPYLSKERLLKIHTEKDNST
jgi:hypothetical protein